MSFIFILLKNKKYDNIVIKNKLINLCKYCDNYLAPLNVILFSSNNISNMIILLNLYKIFPNYLISVLIIIFL